MSESEVESAVVPLNSKGRELRICEGRGVKTSKTINTSMYWKELVERLHDYKVSDIKFADYKKLGKAERAKFKDSSYFVGGQFKDGRRGNNNLERRDVLTLDIDHLDKAESANWQDDLDLCLGDYAYCAYTTFSHSSSAARFRVVMPLTRKVSLEEYAPLCRKIAENLDMNMVDASSFKPSQVMYYPSRCKDSAWDVVEGTGGWINPDEVLAEYTDWRDASEWAMTPRESKVVLAEQKKIGDPREKAGLIGAFCRAYGIAEAISEFIPDVYEETDGSEGSRFTYMVGSTANGARVYDDLLLYSEHDTDPCNGHCYNAFDMVRLHLYGNLDDGVKERTPINKYPSFVKMMSVVDSDKRVVKEHAVASIEGFENVDEVGDWFVELKRDPTGVIKPIFANMMKIMQNDKDLKDLLRFDAREISITLFNKDIPWRTVKEGGSKVSVGIESDRADGSERWNSAYIANLREFISDRYGVSFDKGSAGDALQSIALMDSYDPTLDYLKGLEGTWDGVERIDAFFPDYFNSEDNAYTRATGRKMLMALVARTYNPGCKFDVMTVIEGKQGAGKSRGVAALSPYDQWYTDGFNNFAGKEAVEAILGLWVIEVSELQGFKNADVELIKGFLSKTKDMQRMAYGAHRQSFPRRCVFIGTTNNSEYLKDGTGNRRFYPIKSNGKVDVEGIKRDRDQLYAEAIKYFKAGEKLYIENEKVLALAEREQEARKSEGKYDGLVEEFLNSKADRCRYDVGVDWCDKDAFEGMEGSIIEERTRVTAIEVWCDMLGKNIDSFNMWDNREINTAIEQVKGWKKHKNKLPFGVRFGRRYGYTKDN